MRRLLYASVVVCLAGGLAWRFGAAPSRFADPEDGRVTDGVYGNDYFDLAYPLPPGWREGIAGPPPSRSGYYVLAALDAKDESAGTILITAQDMLFAAEPSADAAAVADGFARKVTDVEGMTIDRGRSEMRIAGRPMSRVDFSGVGLYRAMVATEIRCHIVSFHLTTRDPGTRDALVESLNRIAFGGRGPPTVPRCLRGYAVADNLLQRVEPSAIDSGHLPVPVRMTIGPDGAVTHVHVIRASAEQRRNIEDALGRWTFKPYRVDERAVEVETGLLLAFKHGGSASSRP
jgi:hypothetical protein